MDKEIKARWLTALRSGEYEQGKNALRNGDNFCCLGVLCDLHAKETGGGWVQSKHQENLLYEDHDDVPPRSVIEWSGIPHACGASLAIPGHHRDVDITELNDSGFTFEEIADLIEEQL